MAHATSHRTLRISPPSQRSAAYRCAIVLIAAGIGVSCAGPELPNAPDPPHIDHTATLPPLTPGQTPDPSQTLPPAPHNGQLVATGGGYLEFLSNPENGLPLYFLFPYDSQLSPLILSTVGNSATLTIDGTPQAMTAATDPNNNNSLFFYVYPQLSGSTHQIQATATISGTTYTGTFHDP